MRPLDFANDIRTIPIGPPGRQGLQGEPGRVGNRGLQGIQGVKGDPGKQIFAVQGEPNVGIGSAGDFALDVTNFLFYGPKANGSWGTGVPYGVANPRYVWDGTSLALYNADGTLGEPVDLRGQPGIDGEPGEDGGPIPPGGQPGQYPTPTAAGGYEWRTPVTADDLAKKLDKAGGTVTGALRLEPLTLAANNGSADFSARSIFNMSMSAAMTLAVSGLADGQSGQVFLTYTGGALSFSGVDRWAVSDAEIATAFTATAVGAAGLVANASYEFVFVRSGGITQGMVRRRS